MERGEYNEHTADLGLSVELLLRAINIKYGYFTLL